MILKKSKYSSLGRIIAFALAHNQSKQELLHSYYLVYGTLYHGEKFLEINNSHNYFCVNILESELKNETNLKELLLYYLNIIEDRFDYFKGLASFKLSKFF